MSTLKAKGAKHGIGLFTLTPSGGSVVINTSKAALQSRRHSKDVEMTELRDEGNEIIGLALSNATTELSFTCVFIDATNIANAITNRDAMFALALWTTCTIADTDGTILDTDFQLVALSANQSNSEFETVDVTLRKYTNALGTTIT